MPTTTTKKPTTAAQCDCALTDKDIISDVLGCQKSLVKLYGEALCESSCEKMRTLVSNQMTECACDQFDAFNYMSARGLYPTEDAPSQKVTQAKDKFCKCKDQMKK